MCYDFRKRKKKKQKICNRSVKWVLALRLLFVHVRSTPLGNRTAVLVRCCAPNKDHPSGDKLQRIYWFWTMIIKITDFQWNGKMYLCTFFLHAVYLYVYTVSNSKYTQLHKKIHLSRITNETLHSK